MIPILIVGTGFSGLGLAIRLRQSGRTDFVVLERGDDVGGTWRDNRYPGCACDVQSHLYSFSFAPNPSWTRSYSPQPEIFQYLRACADRSDVRKFIRFGVTVRAIRWLGSHWVVETSNGVFEARAVVLGVGPLSEPAVPALKGLASFRGPVFHSAEWDSSFKFEGKRVGVIGTGASAVQFIPILQKSVARMTVFQRTAAWVVPRPNRAFSGFEKSLFARVPSLQRLSRFSLFWLREMMGSAFHHPKFLRGLEWFSLRRLARDVRDPVLRAKLTPHYTIGCKRILLSDEYWPALAQANVDVVTDSIEEVVPEGVRVRGGDGRVIELDALIFATGFRVTDSPFYSKVFGRDGQTLFDSWQGSPRAYLGVAVHGFPNLFLMLGPNTGLGHTSVVLMVEAQIEHIVRALDRLRVTPTLEARLAAQQAWVKGVDESLKTTVWNTGGCQSWYLDRTGRNSTIWPKSVVSYQKLMHATGHENYDEI